MRKAEFVNFGIFQPGPAVEARQGGLVGGQPIVQIVPDPKLPGTPGAISLEQLF
jgi:hypothetical protein